MASASSCWPRLADSATYFALFGSVPSVITLIDSTVDSGALPMMPLVPPSWPCPAIREAIQVPCTPQFGSDGGVLTPVKSGPVRTLPTRSETVGLTPLSITATTTPLPSDTDQAAGRLSSLSTQLSVLRTMSALAGPTPSA